MLKYGLDRIVDEFFLENLLKALLRAENEVYKE